MAGRSSGHWSKPAEPEPEVKTTYTATGQAAMFASGEDLPIFTGGAYGGVLTLGMEPTRLPTASNPATDWAKRYDANERKRAVRDSWRK